MDTRVVCKECETPVADLRHFVGSAIGLDLFLEVDSSVHLSALVIEPVSKCVIQEITCSTCDRVIGSKFLATTKSLEQLTNLFGFQPIAVLKPGIKLDTLQATSVLENLCSALVERETRVTQLEMAMIYAGDVFSRLRNAKAELVSKRNRN